MLSPDLNPDRYFDLSLRSVPGPRRTFIPSGEVAKPTATIVEATESFTRRIKRIDSQLPMALPSVFSGAVLDCDYNGTIFTNIDFNELPDFFREALRNPMGQAGSLIPSEEPSRMDLITYWAPTWANMQMDIFYADRQSWHGRDYYEVETRLETGLQISNSAGREVVLRNRRLTAERDHTKITAEERLDTTRFTGQLLDVVDLLLNGDIGNHRIQQRLAHASRTA